MPDRTSVFQAIGMFYGKLYDVGRDPGAIVSVEDGNRIAGTIYASWRRQSGNGCIDELAAPADHEAFSLAASPTVLAAANLKSLAHFSQLRAK